MDINAGNKLIAEFMSLMVFQNYEECQEVPLDVLKEYVLLEQAKYHTSWDWQIPAWNKLCSESLKRAITKEWADVHNKMVDNYSNCVHANNIMQGFKCLVNGIQWYNQKENK
jgi:hypothetical protein